MHEFAVDLGLHCLLYLVRTVDYSLWSCLFIVTSTHAQHIFQCLHQEKALVIIQGLILHAFRLCVLEFRIFLMSKVEYSDVTTAQHLENKSTTARAPSAQTKLVTHEAFPPAVLYAHPILSSTHNRRQDSDPCCKGRHGGRFFEQQAGGLLRRSSVQLDERELADAFVRLIWESCDDTLTVPR